MAKLDCTFLNVKFNFFTNNIFFSKFKKKKKILKLSVYILEQPKSANLKLFSEKIKILSGFKSR